MFAPAFDAATPVAVLAARSPWSQRCRRTALTLSCAAGVACGSRSGAPVAAIKLNQRDAMCNRRDATALATM
jgi:hypothetical protein